MSQDNDRIVSNWSRVARWYIFKPKILVWVNSGGSYNDDVGIFYGHLAYHLAYFTAIWYIFWLFGICIVWVFGIFFPVLVCCTEKNLATLNWCRKTPHDRVFIVRVNATFCENGFQDSIGIEMMNSIEEKVNALIAAKLPVTRSASHLSLHFRSRF
jgi:hypothetical protein